MATTKTLAPTNQQITIAAFSGEKPDQRQIADAESKMADAINELNSKKAKGAFQSWGSSLSATGFHHGLLLVAYTAAYIVWFSSTDGINIRSLRASDGSKSGNGSLSFGADDVSGTTYTITRSGTDITVSYSGGSTAITLLYM